MFFFQICQVFQKICEIDFQISPGFQISISNRDTFNMTCISNLKKNGNSVQALRPDLSAFKSLTPSDGTASPVTMRRKGHSRTDVIAGLIEEEEEEPPKNDTIWEENEVVSVPAHQGGCGACTIS